jgi:DNA-binding GntR family transcriptional regulator
MKDRPPADGGGFLKEASMSNENMEATKSGETGKSSSARVVNYVRDAIADGALWPNQRLVEAELAERLGVSRTPVREAIVELARLGLVRTVRNRGAFVVPRDQQELQELSAIRSVLEGLAGRLATERIQVDEIDALEGLNTRMNTLVDEGDVDRFVELNSQFHHLLYKNCGNNNLREMIGNLLERTRAMRVRLWQSRDLAHRSVGEHAEIVAALRRRDPSGVENLLRRHIKRPPMPSEDPGLPSDDRNAMS